MSTIKMWQRYKYIISSNSKNIPIYSKYSKPTKQASLYLKNKKEATGIKLTK